MTDWTDGQDQLIRDNREQCTAEQIAGIINREFGWDISRNAVCGRVHRLGLEPIRKPGRPRINGELKERKRPTKQFASPPVAVAPLNIPFVDLEDRHCREVVGQDGFQSLSCGHPRMQTSSYCCWHHAINYTTPATRHRAYYRV